MIPIPRHGLGYALGKPVRGRVAQQGFGFANVGLAVAHVACPEVAVDGLRCKQRLPRFGGSDVLLQRITQSRKQLIEGGAVAHGHVVDLV